MTSWCSFGLSLKAFQSWQLCGDQGEWLGRTHKGHTVALTCLSTIVSILSNNRAGYNTCGLITGTWSPEGNTGVCSQECRIGLFSFWLRAAGWDLRSDRVLCRPVVAPERDFGHCTVTTSLSSGGIERSKADREEEERNQPPSAHCWITPVHASLWTWTEVLSVDSCSLEALLLLSCSSLLLGRGTAWGRTFMSIPGKSRQVASHRAHWSTGFAPGFKPACPLAELWGAAATSWWAMRGTLAGQHLPPWHLELEEVMFGHSLYRHKKTKRESELAQYTCWRKPDSTHWTDLLSLQISPEFGLCSSSCSSDSVEKRATEVGRPQRRTSRVHTADNSILPSWRAGFDLLVGLLYPVTLILHGHGWSSLLFPAWSLQPLSCCRLGGWGFLPRQLLHMRSDTKGGGNFIPPNRKPCVNSRVPGRNILGLSFICAVNDVSSEWWVVIESCIQILISQKYGHN